MLPILKREAKAGMFDIFGSFFRFWRRGIYGVSRVYKKGGNKANVSRMFGFLHLGERMKVVASHSRRFRQAGQRGISEKSPNVVRRFPLATCVYSVPLGSSPRISGPHISTILGR